MGNSRGRVLHKAFGISCVPTEQHLGINNTRSSRKGTLHCPSFKPSESLAEGRVCSADLHGASSHCHLLSPKMDEPHVLSTLALGVQLGASDSPGLSPLCRHRAVKWHSRCSWELNVLKRWLLSSLWRRHRLWQLSALGTKSHWVEPVRLYHDIYLQGRKFSFPYVMAFQSPHYHCQPWSLMQWVVVLLSTHHHRHCLSIRSCECTASADVNELVVLNKL